MCACVQGLIVHTTLKETVRWVQQLKQETFKSQPTLMTSNGPKSQPYKESYSPFIEPCLAMGSSAPTEGVV